MYNFYENLYENWYAFKYVFTYYTPILLIYAWWTQIHLKSYICGMDMCTFVHILHGIYSNELCKNSNGNIQMIYE